MSTEKKEKKGKTVTLSFQTEEELALHEKLMKAADDDGRSLSTMLVRLLLGKEDIDILKS